MSSMSLLIELLAPASTCYWIARTAVAIGISEHTYVGVSRQLNQIDEMR